MSRRLTIKEIAEIAGVSKATVSRVINGKKEVSNGTRKRIKKIIEEYNYTPSAIARGLSLKGIRNIGLVIPHTAEYLFSFPYFSELIRGISHYANTKGYRLVFATSSSESPQERVYQDMINGSVVDGVVVLDIRKNDGRLEYLHQSDVPFAIVGRSLEYPQVDYVDSDNVGGAREAIEYLLKLGHREILFINGPKDHTVSINRERGYQEAFEAKEVPIKKENIIYGDFSIDYGYKLIKSLLVKGKRFSALFAASDLSAMGAITALKEKGIEVGKDVSVIGFDDIPLARIFDPPLSTVRQPIYEIGKEVGRALISRIEERDREPIQKVLPTKLILRESTIKSRCKGVSIS